MSHQCGYFPNYSDLLTLLQCQPATNVNIVVQLHIYVNIIYNFFFLTRKNRAKL